MLHIFIGTKAQLIKMAPIMRELQDRNIEYNFIFSGQHQETINNLRENFGIKEPDITLHKGRDITSVIQMLFWIIKIITISITHRKRIWKGDKYGIVLNHGDTFSTLAGTILARISGHKSAHIESGLRSFSYLNPFPEELTRVIVFYLSNHFFCQNEWALKNLSKFTGNKYVTNGNTLYDSLITIKAQPRDFSQIIPKENYAIASFHRFENIFKKDQLIRIIDQVEITAKHIRVLVIAHKPTINNLEKFGLHDRITANKNIEIRPRYDYSTFISLLERSEFILTDGGSNQEECYYLGKPCLILRNATERSEGIGENAMLSNQKPTLTEEFVKNYARYKRAAITINPSPTKIIVDSLIELHSISSKHEL